LLPQRCFDFISWSAGRCDFNDPSLKWAYCLDEKEGKQLCKSCRKHFNRFFSKHQREVAEKRHLLQTIRELEARITNLETTLKPKDVI
jgi:hypothetical protein